MSRVWVVLFLAFAGLGAFAWANDKITPQGERTIYTVVCMHGAWSGNRCTGKLAASSRYRFRTLKPHSEVLFWTLGTTEPSGKYTDCSIQDGQNWMCKPNADTERTIAHEMVHGRPVSDPAAKTLPFHEAPKWKWMLLSLGVPVAGTVASQ